MVPAIRDVRVRNALNYVLRAAHSPASGVVEREGWKEAAIAWEVCASLHRQWAKGKDALFTTRQTDFVKHAADARAALATQPLEQKPVASITVKRSKGVVRTSYAPERALLALPAGDYKVYLAPAQPEQVAQDSGPLTDRELAAIGRVINVAPLMLPKWSAVRIELEKDAGTVYWLDVKSGAWRHVDGGGEPFSEQISVAVGRAARASGQGGGE